MNLKDPCIGANIYKIVKMKMQQTNIDIFSNQNLRVKRLFMLTYSKMTNLKGIKP